MSKTMTLDAIVHDKSVENMAKPIDERFFGREHLRKVHPIVLVTDESVGLRGDPVLPDNVDAQYNAIYGDKLPIVGHTTPREVMLRLKPRPGSIPPEWW